MGIEELTRRAIALTGENFGIVGGVMPIQDVCVMGVGKYWHPCTRCLCLKCRDAAIPIQDIYEEVQR
ncbi:MAG: hypothetical protein EA343_02720 [Nodularia sp. (in: Bacteria)]|nr:MAG: hypothetical protein EA343_02720 [Nodularia sp. (in: cyanobacteria)]